MHNNHQMIPIQYTGTRFEDAFALKQDMQNPEGFRIVAVKVDNFRDRVEVCWQNPEKRLDAYIVTYFLSERVEVRD